VVERILRARRSDPVDEQRVAERESNEANRHQADRPDPRVASGCANTTIDIGTMTIAASIERKR
jgi:hypothetical protein